MVISSLPSFSVQRELLGTLRSQWHKAILQALQNSKRNMVRSKRLSRCSVLYPYLCLLPDEEYVDIMLQVRACPALTGVRLDRQPWGCHRALMSHLSQQDWSFLRVLPGY